MRASKKSLSGNEQGMAAIVLTTVLMLVISLIVIGYAHSIRLAQRNALDAQLSTQAFYAAESGVNLGKKMIGASITSKTNCPEQAGYPYAIDASTASAITCVLISPDADHQEYKNIGSQAKVAKIAPSDPLKPIDELYINWQTPANPAVGGCASATNLPSVWGCAQPILRVDLIPIGFTDLGHQLTTFLRPESGLASTTDIPYPAVLITTGAQLNQIQCGNIPVDSKYTCTAKISSLPANIDGFGLRFMSYYGSADISVYAYHAGSLVNVTGQYVIDATAQAAGVVRRVKAYITEAGNPAESSALNVSPAGIGICKMYEVDTAAGSIANANGCPTD